MNQLKVCSYNLENFYLGLEKYSNEEFNTIDEVDWQRMSVSMIQKNKPLFKIQGIAKAILEINADVYCLQEVMSYKSLKNLNQYFLNDQYNVVVEESNSNRSIYVGFLIRKGIEFETESHSRQRLSSGQWMSRNLTSITIKNNTGEKKVTILGVHLKSKRMDDVGTNTYNIRELEVGLISNVQEKLKFKHEVPLIIMGDMNANFNLEPEFHHLKKAGYFDFLLEKHQSDYPSKGTFSTSYLETKVQHLDFILVESKYLKKLDMSECGIYYYTNEYGDKISLPYEKIERPYLPSDHCPIFSVLKF